MNVLPGGSKAFLIGCLGLATLPTMAVVKFDGLTWHLSRDPSRLALNERSELVWQNPHAPDQVTVQLPPMDLTKVGAVARVDYVYKAEGKATGIPGTDPTLLSGTGDIRIGLFDSNGQGHINRDDAGFTSEIWRGYLGYCARVCPHLPVGIKREHSDAIPGKFMKRTGITKDTSTSLLQTASPYGKSQDLSGFGLKLGVAYPLTMQIERTAPDTLVFSVTMNDVTYRYVDNDPRLQPKKIDALAMYFPNPKAYTSITLAGSCFSSKAGGGGAATGGTARPPSIEFASISAGTSTMGADLPPEVITAEKGIFIQDEFPVRQVRIKRGFDMSKREITNLEYEKYDPAHAAWRGKAPGISTNDNEAVVYVDWNDAAAFCKWWSAQDERYDYRLPTEVEWEYACRAGTRTPFNDGVSGDIYSLNPLGSLADTWHVITNWFVTRSNGKTEKIAWPSPHPVDLTVGKQGPNAWGLFDMHGGVEEWCSDWYGPYEPTDITDPVGYADGSSKVVRGGSHNVQLQTLRSANRSSANRTDKHFLLGFRVVRVPKGQTLPVPKLKQPVQAWANNVSAQIYSWPADRTTPHFELASLYDMHSAYGTPELRAQFELPLYTHNHSPAITWAQNGDILLAWFTGESEKGQELTIPALRGRRQKNGSLRWDTQVSEFYKVADRNMHGVQLWNNATRLAHGFKEPFTLYHINGICTDGKWSKLAMSFRQSTNNGATWSEPVIMKPDSDALHLDSNRNQPQGNVMVASDGAFISFSDGSALGGSGSSVNWSGDGGKTWAVRTLKAGPPGNHVGGVQLTDGRILAFSRDQGGRTFGTLPRSLSDDQGKTWSFSATEFPPVSTFQRLALLRLEYSSPVLDPAKQGRKPILLISFAADGMDGKDANGKAAKVSGTYAALSWDEGNTWPVKRVLSDVKSGSKDYVMGPWNKPFALDATHGQARAYWAATQSPDGIVYLSDGRLSYAFNLAWLTQSPARSSD